ncbi:Daunorubicin/doxorubicin resistance ABC transporter permease protein DrrB [Methylacidimicrobium cyclopophantes]|uniref:Transport permease protein n=1 Tax=Methylacidimicrobium cyclopophantes TaxID=1041766 RepID=A0A5E6MRI2_9BACT|nr:ABC transporter permease [Methylacidimicrobium cyclopophantes]VVM08540.1 Daunorubicin/doxorubicin resistance ABC transporter permease protein DrrB [Methylacidimicrobium cyclopophantes]
MAKRLAELLATWDQTVALAEAELRKLRHDPIELFTRIVQPLLWLLIFGKVMDRIRAIPTGGLPYLDFLAPGILAQSALFLSIFYGISTIWERDSGVLTRYLVSPAPRWTLVLGKALGGGVRSLSQAIVIFGLAAALGVQIRWRVETVLAMLLFTLLGSALFSTLSLIVACLVKTRERLIGIGQLLTMPLFFASNAIYPLQLMPAWLCLLARFNPLTYLVDALRALMLARSQSSLGLGTDFAVLALTLVLLIALAARLYPRILL